MSSLTLLTATVVVLGLWCWVPTGAHNPRMVHCNRTAMPVVSFNSTKLQGRWYLSHYTVSDSEPTYFNGFVNDIGLTIQDANGQETPVFFVAKTTTTSPTQNYCKKTQTLTQIIGNKFSSNYKVSSYIKSVAGYWIYHFDNYVLATDYTSTVVVMKEMIFGANYDIRDAGIKVYVRDPTTPPNADVVNAALKGFCKGDFLDLSSNYYARIPNDSKLTCFAAPVSSGAGNN